MTRWVWVAIAALFVPFAVVAGVAVVVLAVSGSVAQADRVSLAAGTVPSAYVSMIETASNTCAILSPPLLAAQLYQESGFNPEAVSPTGAEGIAQFEPGTWPNWSSPQDGDGKQNPFDAADAIPAAARYDCALAQQVKQLPGNQTSYMLAAYNAGLGAVLAAGGVPDITQTQNYVKNIEILEQAFAAPTTTTLAASSVAVRAIAFAYDRLGTPYLWGGTGTAAENGEFDCSGLTQAAYGSAGVTIPRVAADQWYAGPHVPKDQLQPGDLVFFAYDVNNPATIHHVGIYVGGGAMIDAPHTGASIRFDSISESDYIGAVRPYAQVPQWPIGPSTTAPTGSATSATQ
jgi:cell wall-associated NlpC family hydrolase